MTVVAVMGVLVVGASVCGPLQSEYPSAHFPSLAYLRQNPALLTQVPPPNLHTPSAQSFGTAFVVVEVAVVVVSV